MSIFPASQSATRRLKPSRCAVLVPVPAALVGVMAGAHRVNVVAPEGLNGGGHVRLGDGAAPFGVPFMPVDAVEHDALTVQAHDKEMQTRLPRRAGTRSNSRT